MIGDPVNIVGKPHVKKEAYLKATGKLKYTGDIRVEGALRCKILRSPHANALVKSIDTSEAWKVPGVADIITYEDVPKILSMHQFLHVPEMIYRDSYLLEKHVRYVGDRVAAVAAETEEAALEAVSKIKVEYEVLPAAITIEQTLAEDAPVIHEEARRGDKAVDLKGNILEETDTEVGDVEAGFAEAEVIFERTYYTSHPNNGQLERSAAWAIPREDGRIDVYATNQGIHATRQNIARSLGIPVSRLCCHRTFLGGSFGAHIHTGFHENIVVFLAMRTKRPVFAEKTREEIFMTCGRHPMMVMIRAGFKKDGTLTAVYSDTIDNTGAYAFSGGSKMQLTSGFSLSMYKVPNVRMTGRSVYTNTPPLTAMRGAGNPQANWAFETFMDEVSEELNLDPIEIRLKNNLGVGDIFYGQGPAVTATIRSCGTPELLKAGAELYDWDKRGEMNHTPYPDRPWIRRGIGVSRGFHTSGCGSEKPNRFIIDFSGAYVKMNEDGTAQLTNAVCDLGGGAFSAHAALVAEAIGLKYDDVVVNEGDTDTALFDGPTHASRGLYGAGQAVVKASYEVRVILEEWAARIFSCGREDIIIKDSMVYPNKREAEAIPVSEVVSTGHFSGWGVAASTASVRPTNCPPHNVVVFAVVDVDTRTGHVDIVRAFSGVDTGTPINLNSVYGQMIGGLHMGFGFALTEDTLFDPQTGACITSDFSNFHILTMLEMPDRVDKALADTYEPTGPFGAKAIGEGVTNPVAAAIGNAIHNACGIRLRDLPMNPASIIRALEEQEKLSGQI